MQKIELVLIGNYLPDKQESMIRFAHLLDTGFCNANLHTEIWWPTVGVGKRLTSTNNGMGKWLGYIDKYILFPMVLKRRLKNIQLINPKVKFHICDHSNAPYLKYLPADRTSITCHDVIAIRGAMGYSDSFQPASGMGKLLQKWILQNLKKARSIAFVSQHTFNQFKEIVSFNEVVDKKFQVIHNSFNNDFEPMDLVKAKVLLHNIGINTDIPFLLHVGSGSVRKNRALLIEMTDILKNKISINCCFAGEALDDELLVRIKTLGISDRVISIVKPDHEILVALYSCCAAFIFPSLSEGFGWPLIEAQACGAVVIASNTEPMPEVSGGAALHFDPAKPADFANGFYSLQNQLIRNKLVETGFLNCKRFESMAMVKAYLNLLGLN